VGIINATRLASGHLAADTGAELTAIATCVIDGVSLYSGRGSILGVVIGAAIMGVLQNATIILRVSSPSARMSGTRPSALSWA
jgi:ribose transport system permease protein